MPVANLSNGQTRRARIAKALLNKPELLLLDDPFSKFVLERDIVLKTGIDIFQWVWTRPLSGTSPASCTG